MKWNTKGPTDGELTFVSGNPGKTDRQLTVSELKEVRDQEMPYLLSVLYRRETFLHSFANRSFENARRVQADVRSIENSRKAFTGYLGGLLDPTVWNAIEEREQKLRLQTEGVRFRAGKVDMAAHARRLAHAGRAAMLRRHSTGRLCRDRPTATYRAPRGFYSTFFKYARRLLRSADETSKPNGERFPEFRDSNKESLELDLFSSAPVYDDVEIAKLKDSFTDLASRFGADDPLVKQVLAGKSPVERAAELVKGTKLKDVATRKQLYAGRASAIAAAHDPMIDLASDRRPARARKVFEAQDETAGLRELASAFRDRRTDTYPTPLSPFDCPTAQSEATKKAGRRSAADHDCRFVRARSRHKTSRPSTFETLA